METWSVEIFGGFCFARYKIDKFTKLMSNGCRTDNVYSRFQNYKASISSNNGKTRINLLFPHVSVLLEMEFPAYSVNGFVYCLTCRTYDLYSANVETLNKRYYTIVQ